MESAWLHPGSPRPQCPVRPLLSSASGRRPRFLIGGGLALALAMGTLLSACQTTAGAGGAGVIKPAGLYSVTMASAGLVSEGTMRIHGAEGNYRGTLSIGGMSATVRRVEVGEGTFEAELQTPSGTLVLRLVGDESFLTGNWLLGGRRGTFTAERVS